MIWDFGERRDAPAPKVDLRIEALEWEALAKRRAAWRHLVSSTIEPNIFLDPDFALPAVQHLKAARLPIFLLASKITPAGACDEMVGLWPIVLPVREAEIPIARTWMHEYAVCGSPLLDTSLARDVFPALLGWIESAHPEIAGIELPCLAQNGPIATLIQSQAKLMDRSLHMSEPRLRQVLSRNKRDEADHSSIRHEDCARSQTQRRQWRKLNARGTVRYTSSRRPEDVRVSMERFLALEAAGWKGRRGTALLNDPGAVTFARAMTRLLSRGGRCRIDSLELDGTSIAMLIVLQSGARAFTWKIAHDEQLSAFSPGTQLMLEFTHRQRLSSDADLTDSCSTDNNSLVSRLWSEKVEMVDFILASSSRTDGFSSTLARELMHRKLRSRAKDAYAKAVSVSGQLTGR